MANELKIRVVFDTGGADKPLGDLPPKIKAVEGSLKDLENQWKKLDLLAKSQYAVGSPQQVQAIANASMAYKRYQEAVAQTSTIVAQNTRVSANAGMTLQALNYTIRDSPYFFRDFSLGILAVGNNLNPLIDGLIRMNKEAKDAGTSLGKTLWGSLKGSQGVIFAFSALVSILQAVTFALAKNKSDVKETKEEYDDLATAVKNYSRQTLNDAIRDEERLLRAVRDRIALEKEQHKKREDMKRRGMEARGEIYTPSTFDPTTHKDYPEYQRREKSLAILYAEITSLGDLSNLQREINQKIKERNDLMGDPEAEKRLTLEIDALQKQYNERTKINKEILDGKEKQYIQTDAQLKTEIQIYETLLLTAQSERERVIIHEQLADLKEELSKYTKDEYDVLAKYSDLQGELEGSAKNWADYVSKVTSDQAFVDMIEAYVKRSNKTYYEDDPFAGVAAKSQKEIEGSEKEQKEATKRAQENLQFLSRIAQTTGDAIYDAFMHGKLGVEEFIKSVLIAIGRLLFLKAIEEGISNITSLVGLGGGGGGISPSYTAKDWASGNPIRSMTPSANNDLKVLRQLQVLNTNLALLQPQVFINADTDAVRFTKRKTNPSQRKLTNGNVKDVP